MKNINFLIGALKFDCTLKLEIHVRVLTGHRMIQTPMNLLMSESRSVGLSNSTVSAGDREPTYGSQAHGTAYSSFSKHALLHIYITLLCYHLMSGYDLSDFFTFFKFLLSVV